MDKLVKLIDGNFVASEEFLVGKQQETVRPVKTWIMRAFSEIPTKSLFMLVALRGTQNPSVCSILYNRAYIINNLFSQH